VQPNGLAEGLKGAGTSSRPAKPPRWKNGNSITSLDGSSDRVKSPSDMKQVCVFGDEMLSRSDIQSSSDGVAV
jgi:hypothetical protein